MINFASPDDLVLPEPIGLQPAWLASTAARKVLRVGRRGSKTRFALVAAFAGHGDGEDGAKQFPGILEGGDVVWVAVDYPNLIRVVWKEEIKPRFGNLSWAHLSEKDHTCTLDGLGTLHLVSAEAIDGIRGMGKRVRGIIVDEAAHLDLEQALLDVLLPVCLDNEAWLILMSTTNAGLDGNTEKRTPSYFNVICEQIRDGGRSGEWEEFTGTAFDNPTISPKAIHELIGEYGTNKVQLDQEVYAKLLKAGAGIAFPEFSEEVHVLPQKTEPNHRWNYYAGLDWGYVRGAYVLMGAGPDGELEQIWEYFDDFTGLHAREAAERIAKASRHLPLPEYIMADEQMWQQVGMGTTLADDYLEGLAKVYGGLENAPGLVKATHKSGSRAVKKNMSHRWLSWTGTPGSQKPWERPKYRIQPTCRKTIEMWQKLPLDPKRPDDVDTTHALDHLYDACGFVFASRPEPAIITLPPHDAINTDAGIDFQRKRVMDWSGRSTTADHARQSEENSRSVPGMPAKGFTLPGYGIVGSTRAPQGWQEGFTDED